MASFEQNLRGILITAVLNGFSVTYMGDQCKYIKEGPDHDTWIYYSEEQDVYIKIGQGVHGGEVDISGEIAAYKFANSTHLKGCIPEMVDFGSQAGVKYLIIKSLPGDFISMHKAMSTLPKDKHDLLCEAICRLCGKFRRYGFAHGDLHHENIFVDYVTLMCIRDKSDRRLNHVAKCIDLGYSCFKEGEIVKDMTSNTYFGDAFMRHLSERRHFCHPMNRTFDDDNFKWLWLTRHDLLLSLVSVFGGRDGLRYFAKEFDCKDTFERNQHLLSFYERDHMLDILWESLEKHF